MYVMKRRTRLPCHIFRDNVSENNAVHNRIRRSCVVGHVSE